MGVVWKPYVYSISMAEGSVLEKHEKRSFLDDTIPLTAKITTHRKKGDHYVYEIRVQRGPNSSDYWLVTHRYNEFATLHQNLQPSGISLPLPPKKVFGNQDRQFLVQRQEGLQNFLDVVLTNALLSSYLETKRFLDPLNYDRNFQQDAHQSVSMFFRSEPSWSIVEPFREIGWRLRKHHFLISNITSPKLSNYLLTWCEPGPDFSLGEKERDACFKVLMDIKHPFILSPEYAGYNERTGMMIVRKFVPSGSLRDLIYRQKPQTQFLQKYGPPRRGLDAGTIALYGRQVLEALKFLSDKGFVLGHVHAGNVIVDGGYCKLVDLENSFMGMPSMYRQYLLDLRKINTIASEAIYSFGHMLYEMGAGMPLNEGTMDTCPSIIPAGIKPVIERILKPQAIKEGLPSLSDLIADPFFSTVTIPPPIEKPYLKVSSRLKEVIKAHTEHCEQRLKDQQRAVSQFKRVSKAQESVMSEEEKKKRRKLRKKQLSLQKVDEQQSYPTTTSLPRQNTIGTSGVSASSSVKTKYASSNGQAKQSTSSSTPAKSSASNDKKSTAKTSTSKAPPPPSSAPPEPRPAPPPARNSERGALLGSIEGFTKGKLKKAKTNDRSAPKV